MNPFKEQIRDFWTRYPCAKNLLSCPEGTKEFFQAHDRLIDQLTPYHHQVYQYELCRGKRVLEIGCGMGSHARRFAEYAREFYAIDLAPKSIELTKRRFQLYNLDSGNIRQGDAEHLPFPDNYFDLVFSNGVIHHTPDTPRAAEEIYRALKPAGRAVIMIYHKNSIFYWFDLMLASRGKYALLKLMPESLAGILFKKKPHICKLKEELNRAPWRELGQTALRFSDGHYNPHTKVYTTAGAKRLFNKFKNVRVELRSSRDRWERCRFLERRFGWGLYVYAEK